MIVSNKRKNFNRNPEGYNQWELRSNVEVQRIIDQKPTWTKKDFRGEGKLNSKKENALLTRTETDRPNLKFGQIGRRKQPLKEVYKHSASESIAEFERKVIDEETFRDRARVKKQRDLMPLNKKQQIYKDRHANLTEKQLNDKRQRDNEYYERSKNN